MNFRSVFTIGLLASGLAVSAYAQRVTMRLINGEAGWVSTDNRLLWTSSAGRVWTDVTPQDAQSLHGATFLDASHGWALVTSAHGFQMARTVDGGKTWHSSAFALAAADAEQFGGSASLHFIDGTHGWAMLRQVSSLNFSIGLLFATADGGATWTKLPNPPIGDAVRFTTATDGWLAGGPVGNKLFVTRDGGRSWSAVHLIPPVGIGTDAEAHYSRPQFAGPGNAVLAAWYSWDEHTALVLHGTHDNGRTWTARTVHTGPAPENPPALALAEGHLMQITSDHAGLLSTAVDEYAAVSDGLIPAEAVVIKADFATTKQGWILTQEGHCNADKSDCSQIQKLLATGDGGKTYRDITPRQMQSVPAAMLEDVPLASKVVGKGEGFDGCNPTVSGMAKWYKDSPYHYMNVYIGGNNAACPQPGLSSSWVSQIVGQGWGLIPTWVGPQAPCTTCSGCGRFSSTPSTAASQGTAEANSAAGKMASIGLGSTIVYYDMEAYNANSSCSAATQAFVNAWVAQLHAKGYTAGVYGSPSNANADWKNLKHSPDDVWIALWNGAKSVSNLSPIPASAWANNQRIHQYNYLGNKTYGGVTVNIDGDFLDAPVAK